MGEAGTWRATTSAGGYAPHVDYSRMIQLQIGSVGNAVQEAQYVLTRFHILNMRHIDAVYGPVTEQGVRTFQNEWGITADGVIGPQTWRTLLKFVAIPPVLDDGSTGTVVKNLQRVLDELRAHLNFGSFPGFSTDGVYGPVTNALVEVLQGWAGIPADGVVGLQTWAVPLKSLGGTLASAVGL